MNCPPKTVQCCPEKHGAINNREAQKICGAPESAGPLALAQSAPPLNPALVMVKINKISLGICSLRPRPQYYMGLRIAGDNLVRLYGGVLIT